jgi:hypothetical protein
MTKTKRFFNPRNQTDLKRGIPVQYASMNAIPKYMMKPAGATMGYGNKSDFTMDKEKMMLPGPGNNDSHYLSSMVMVAQKKVNQNIKCTF